MSTLPRDYKINYINEPVNEAKIKIQRSSSARYAPVKIRRLKSDEMHEVQRELQLENMSRKVNILKF